MRSKHFRWGQRTDETASKTQTQRGPERNHLRVLVKRKLHKDLPSKRIKQVSQVLPLLKQPQLNSVQIYV